MSSVSGSKFGEWWTRLLGWRSAWRALWGGIKDLSKAVPPLELLINQARASASVMVEKALDSDVARAALGITVKVGDGISSIEPDLVNLKLLEYLVLGAKQLNLDGAGKLAEVEKMMRLAWPAIQVADDKFDDAWRDKMRPALEALRERSKAQGVW